MTLKVNFETETHGEAAMSVRDLLLKKRWSFPLIIVRVNGVLVERSAYDGHRLVDGDDVELYHLVSGG